MADNTPQVDGYRLTSTLRAVKSISSFSHIFRRIESSKLSRSQIRSSESQGILSRSRILKDSKRNISSQFAITGDEAPLTRPSRSAIREDFTNSKSFKFDLLKTTSYSKGSMHHIAATVGANNRESKFWIVSFFLDQYSLSITQAFKNNKSSKFAAINTFKPGKLSRSEIKGPRGIKLRSNIVKTIPPIFKTVKSSICKKSTQSKSSKSFIFDPASIPTLDSYIISWISRLNGIISSKFTIIGSSISNTKSIGFRISEMGPEGAFRYDKGATYDAVAKYDISLFRIRPKFSIKKTVQSVKSSNFFIILRILNNKQSRSRIFRTTKTNKSIGFWIEQNYNIRVDNNIRPLFKFDLLSRTPPQLSCLSLGIKPRGKEKLMGDSPTPRMKSLLRVFQFDLVHRGGPKLFKFSLALKKKAQEVKPFVFDLVFRRKE